MGGNGGLTEKQKKFCIYFSQTGNATESYKRAYGDKSDNVAAVSGHQNLRKPKIRAYIEELNEGLMDALMADTEEIKRYWTNIMRNDIEGTNGGLKASEFLAKTNGAFIDKVQLESSVNHKYDNMSEEDIEKEMKKYDVD